MATANNNFVGLRLFELDIESLVAMNAAITMNAQFGSWHSNSNSIVERLFFVGFDGYGADGSTTIAYVRT